MKHAWHTALACAAITTVLILLFAGCGGGGDDNHNNWNGSIYGVKTLPTDGETDLVTDTALKVSWSDTNYPPPTDFTFNLDIEDTPGHFAEVNAREMTDYSDPDNDYWWFEPTAALETGKWYKLTLTDNRGRENVVFFRTADAAAGASGTLAMSAVQTYRPAGEKNRAAKSTDPGAPTLTIRTK